MNPKEFSFIAELVRIDSVYRSYGVFIPSEILSKLPSSGRFRAIGTMNEVRFNLGILSAKERGKYFVISAPFKKAIQAKEGEPVKVNFHLVDGDLLEIPEELEIALEQDPEANAIFSTFTTGMKRSLTHYVKSAKSTETRIKRALQLLQKIKTNSLYAQKNSQTKAK